MSSIDQISKYIYPDDEQQRAEFVQQYRLRNTLKQSLLKELLPDLTDDQIKILLREHNIRTSNRVIARNRRFWFVNEFLYYSRLESLNRRIKCFVECTKSKFNKTTHVSEKPIKWGSRNHKCYLLERHPKLDFKTISKVLKITTHIAKEYNSSINSKESNRVISLS